MLTFFRTLGFYAFFSTAILQGNVDREQPLIDLHTENKKFESRLYLHPTQIYISQDGLFLNLYDQLLPINSIHSDSNGIYVNENEVQSIYWTCKNDHVNYHADYPKCIFCGAGPKSK